MKTSGEKLMCSGQLWKRLIVMDYDTQLQYIPTSVIWRDKIILPLSEALFKEFFAFQRKGKSVTAPCAFLHDPCNVSSLNWRLLPRLIYLEGANCRPWHGSLMKPFMSDHFSWSRELLGSSLPVGPVSGRGSWEHEFSGCSGSAVQ